MRRIGVIGAGTMGAGIAQVAAQAGLDVILYDIGPVPLQAGVERIEAGLARLVQRGRISQAEADAVGGRVSTTSEFSAFTAAEFVVEAVPERLDLKRQIFAELDRVCAPTVVLATNTSSLSVTQVAAVTAHPERVVGMHFFNPVPAMKLVEVVRGARTSPVVAEQTADLARLLGKTPVQATDTPGFIVNRVARPFPGEALRLLGEKVAGVRQIDRAARLGAGFRMGPFELMDLVGMDVNLAVNQSVFEQFFYEPRFRPHPLQAQMVQAGLLGRKSGAGWYRYEAGKMLEPPAGAAFPEKPAQRVAAVEQVCVSSDPDLADLIQEAGYRLTPDCTAADLVILADPAQAALKAVGPEALLLVESSRASVTELASVATSPERVVGYGGIPSVRERQLVEVAVGLRTAESSWQRAAAFFHSLGRETEVIHGAPGLIAPRLIACLANEAAWALMEGIASAADIDTAMRLGVNYPRGPLEWADQIGAARVLGVMEALHRVTGDDRYRPCPLLREVAQVGGRFHEIGH